MLEGIITWAEIDLDAIAQNVEAFLKHVGSEVDVMTVIKANAYKHNTVQVARASLQAEAK